jgi:hypothetical protein
MSDQNLDFMNVDIEIEDRVYGSDYPIIQWLNGDPRQKKAGGPAYTGGFFVSADQQVDLPEGFEPYTLITRDNTEVEGFACRQLTFAPIRRRMCWQVRPDQGLSRRYSWNNFELAKLLGKPRSLVHVLAGIEGLVEPVVLSFAGTVGGKVTSGGTDRGILLRHSNKVVNAARRMSRRNGKPVAFPNCAFWLTIGAARDKDGAPEFSTVGEGDASSTVVFPQWIDEPGAALDAASVNARFVGGANLKKFQAWFQSAEEWTNAWSDEAISEVTAQLPAAQASAQLTDQGGEAGIPF